MSLKGGKKAGIFRNLGTVKNVQASALAKMRSRFQIFPPVENDVYLISLSKDKFFYFHNQLKLQA